jgi:hypothetical protein
MGESCQKVWKELQELVTSADEEAGLILKYIHESVGTMTNNKAELNLREKEKSNVS